MTTKRKIIIVCLLLAGTLLLVAYWLLGPDFRWYLKCPFRVATGYSCPGCGLQRGIATILQGDIAEGVAMNYFFFLVAVPVMALYAFSLLPIPIAYRLRRLLSHPATIGVLGLLTMVWWLVRNIIQC